VDTLVYLLLDNVSESCDMQNRSTILILLFTVTLAVGALTLWQSSNDNEAVGRFRSLFSTSAVYDLQNSLPSVTDQASLLYGGIALLAIIVIVLALRAAWRDSSRSPKNG
jgi:ABC-type phosphate transport system permease subunit